LALSARDLSLQFRDDGSGWSLALSGEGRQSWNAMASRLPSLANIALPGGATFPDLGGTFTVTIDGASSTGTIAVSLALLEPSATDSEVPYAGGLGSLPIVVSDASLIFNATVGTTGVGAWGVSGSGVLGTAGTLRSAVPIDGLTFAVTAGSRG